MNIKKIINLFDSITEWFGKLASWLILLLIFSLVYEVVSRHVFNKPTIWSYDVSYMLGGTAAFFGIAWVQRNRTHVRVDLFYENLSNKNKAILDLVLTTILFLPLMIIAFMNSFEAAVLSWNRLETAPGAWRPPLYPLKTVIPIVLFLLILQGIAEFLRSILKLTGREN